MLCVRNKGYLNLFLDVNLDAKLMRQVGFITLCFSAEYSKQDPWKRHSKLEIFPYLQNNNEVLAAFWNFTESQNDWITTLDEDSTTSLGNLCQCSANLMIKSVFSSCSEETYCVGLKRSHLNSFQERCLALNFRCACCYGCLGSWLMPEPAHHHQTSCSPYLATVELCPSWQDPVPISHAVIWAPSSHFSLDFTASSLSWMTQGNNKRCGTYRIEKSQILTQWRNQGEPRLSSGQQTALYGYYKAAGNEWPGEKRHTVRTDKKKRWEKERRSGREERKKEKDTQHLNRNKRNVSHKTWMKGHAELGVHTRKPRATEDMQMEKITAVWYTGAF